MATHQNSNPIQAAKSLSPASTSADVHDVLVMAVSACFGPLEQCELVSIIAAQTQFKEPNVRKALKLLIAETKLNVPDDVQALAKDVWEHVFGCQFKAGPDGRGWRYTGANWEIVPDQWLRKALNAAFRAPGSPYSGKIKPTVDAALTVLKDMCGGNPDPMTASFDQKAVINCMNGELWLDGESPELCPHNPLSGLVHAPTVKFDLTADCPKFKAALEGIFAASSDPADMIRHLFEVIGYAVRPIRNRPSIIVLHGAGANGKTSIINVIRALIGEPQVYANSISLLSRDRFAIPGLAGKLVWIDDDVKSDLVLDDGMLKTISEAKSLTARRAYGKQEFKFKAMSLPILATNNIPRINDASYGFERRLMVIPFGRKFEPHEIDLNLFKQIISEELPGILNEALAGVKRLDERDDFELPVDCVKANEMFFSHANAFRGFIEERLISDPGKRVPLKEVYDALMAWCCYNGIPRPFARNHLKGKLEGTGLVVKKSNGIMCVVDCMLSPNPLEG